MSKKRRIKISKKYWEQFGKKAGWLNEDGEIVESAFSIDEDGNIIRIAHPAPAAPTKDPDIEEEEEVDPDIDIDEDEEDEEEEDWDDWEDVEVETDPMAEKTNAEAESNEIDISDIPNAFASSLRSKIKVSNKFYETYFEKSAMAEFSDNGNRELQRFWENLPEGHPFSKSDFLKEKGNLVVLDHYRRVTEYAEAEARNWPVFKSYLEAAKAAAILIQEIKFIELSHEDELKQLALETICNIYKVPEKIFENPQIMNNQGGANMKEPPGEDGDNPQDNLQGEPPRQDVINEAIKKKILIESLVHGPALNLLDQAHLYVDEESGFSVPERLREIIGDDAESLAEKNSKFSNTIMQHYFLTSPQAWEGMAEALKRMGTGWSKANSKGGKVQAKGLTFNILVQELAKGLMKRATLFEQNASKVDEHGGEKLTPEEWKKVYESTQQLSLEPLYINFSPETFKKILMAAPTEDGFSLYRFVQYLSVSPKEKVKSVFSAINSNDENELANKIMEIHDEMKRKGFGRKKRSKNKPSIGMPDAEKIEMPDAERGDAPDDWGSIQRSFEAPSHVGSSVEKQIENARTVADLPDMPDDERLSDLWLDKYYELTN